MADHQKELKPVLIVVDVQVDVIANLWDTPRVIQNIRTAVEKARRQNIPVIWVQHSEEGLAFDSPEWQIVPELVPAEGELRIYKNYNSSFEQTDLEEKLAELGATHIVLAGAATNWCIRATAYGALERGFDLTLVKDAHTTESMEFQDGFVVEAEHIIRELNVAMTWVNYPDRKNNIVSTDELDFNALLPTEN
ncbi:MAG TPA: isochorismatase family protein [Anaerolineales bacterium]|nr:isochorismatase family protein [Anaerolineales bacterium]